MFYNLVDQSLCSNSISNELSVLKRLIDSCLLCFDRIGLGPSIFRNYDSSDATGASGTYVVTRIKLIWILLVLVFEMILTGFKCGELRLSPPHFFCFVIDSLRCFASAAEEHKTMQITY